MTDTTEAARSGACVHLGRARVTPTATLRAAMLVACFVSVCSATSAAAQDAESGFRGRVWAGAAGRYVLTDNDVFVDPALGTVGLEVDGSAPTVGADVEYKVNRRWGVDAGLAYTRFDVAFQNGGTADADTRAIGVLPLMFALNFHAVSNRRVDLWLGPQIGYIAYPDDLRFAAGAGRTFEYAPDNAWSFKGFNVGADVTLTPRTALTFGFRWQNSDGDPDGHLTVDPALVVAGLAIRF